MSWHSKPPRPMQLSEPSQPSAIPLGLRSTTATGAERRWWMERKIDLLAVTRSLWRETNGIGDELQKTAADQRS